MFDSLVGGGSAACCLLDLLLVAVVGLCSGLEQVCSKMVVWMMVDCCAGVSFCRRYRG